MSILLVRLFIAAIFVLIWITQVIWPALRGTPLFPWFRREHHLHVQLSRQRQAQLERDLERQLSNPDTTGTSDGVPSQE